MVLGSFPIKLSRNMGLAKTSPTNKHYHQHMIRNNLEQKNISRIGQMCLQHCVRAAALRVIDGAVKGVRTLACVRVHRASS